jgi:hypothetical protein
MPQRFDDAFIAKLMDAVRYSRRRLEVFRNRRLELLREFVGSEYSDNGTDRAVPMNLIELATQIYIRQLAPRNPQVLCTTPNLRLQPIAEVFGLAINKRLVDMDFESVIQSAVMDAIFCIGCVRVGQYLDRTVEIDGEEIPVSGVMVEHIDLDDLVVDMGAKSWKKIQFIGHRYTLPLDEVQASPLFDKKVTKGLVPSSRTMTNEDGDDRVETIGNGAEIAPDTVVDVVELLDIYLPHYRALATLQWDASGVGDTKPLRFVEWNGPAAGPYRILSMTPVPGNLMPLAPAMTWKSMHDLVNHIYRKLCDQEMRRKTILVGLAGADTDAARVMNAMDGEVITMGNPSAVKEMSFGGASPEGMAFLLSSIDKASWVFGNLDALGGLSAQAGTLGQEELLFASSSKRIQDMQARVTRFTSELVKDIAWYIWEDPFYEQELVRNIEGTDIVFADRFSAEMRQGDFSSYQIRVEPYSLQEKTPQEKLAQLMQLLQQFLLPSSQLLAMQGLGINLQKVLDLISKYGGLPELASIIMPMPRPDGEMPQPDMGMPEVGKPIGPRVEHRISQPGGTRSGRDSVMIQTLLGAKSQPSMQEKMGGPIK